MNLLNKCRNIRHPRTFLICAATLILFFKSIYFHALTFSEFPRFGCDMALTLYKFYMAKLLCPILVASILLLTPKKYWVTLCMLLADLLCIANIIYFKCYDLFLTIDDILLVGNMDGAWTSIEAYLDVRLLMFLISTLLWIVLSIPVKIHNRLNISTMGGVICFLCVLGYVNNILVYDYTDACRIAKFSNRDKDTPFTLKKYCRLPFLGLAMHSIDNRTYVYEQSILSYFPSSVIAFVRDSGKKVELTVQDISLIEKLTNTETCNNHLEPTHSVIIILVESLESWVINQFIDGVELTPFLNKLTSSQKVLYCDKIKSQTLAGNSGDGQMIVNSGLLPLKHGAACMSFYSNVYPNIANLYSSSYTINPWPHIWNQTVMSKRYGYKQLLEPAPNEEWQDADVLKASSMAIDNATSKFCLMGITVSMHSPFTRVSNPLDLSNHTPDLLQKYMECVNYTDKCIEYFVSSQLNDSVRENTTIVITSDHTIFKPAMLTDYVDYATHKNLSIASKENYCPLIIYSPQIEGNVQIDELCYQMDIFPTIMHLIGCEDYYWKGFGVNLLDSVARRNRPITEKEAYELSDKLIRSNYFSSYVDK